MVDSRRAWTRAALLAALCLVLPGSAHGSVVAGADPSDLLIVDRDVTCAGASAKGAVVQAHPDGTGVRVVSSGGSFADPSGIAIAADGTLYVADPNADDSVPPVGCSDNWDGNGAVFRIDPATGGQTEVAGLNKSSLNLFADPTAIIPRANGHLLVLDPNSGASGNGGLIDVDPATGDQAYVRSTFSPCPLVDPTGMALDDTGRIYIVDPDAYGLTGGVCRLDADGSNPVTVSQNGVAPQTRFGNPGGIVVRRNGRLLVADNHGGEDGSLTEVDPALPNDANQLSTVFTFPEAHPGLGTTPLADPVTLTMIGNGDILVADPQAPASSWAPGPPNGAIFRVTLDNVVTTVVGTGFVDPVAVAVVPNRRPEAALTPAAGRVGELVVLDASGSRDPDGSPLSYRFDTDGNGSLDTAPSPAPTLSTVFSKEGDYVVGVEVTDPHGGVAAATARVSVTLPPPVVPDPLPPAPGPAPATKPPDTPPDLTVPPSITVEDLVNKGITAGVTCTQDCTIQGTLYVDSSDYGAFLKIAAQRLIVIGGGKASLKAGRTGKLKIKLNAKTKRKIKIALAALVRSAARRKINLILKTTTKLKSGKKLSGKRKIVLKG
jgi:glucose/arabinose dehydrogenase